MVLRPSAVEVDDTLDALVEQQQSSEQRGSDAGGADAARRHHTGEPAHEGVGGPFLSYTGTFLITYIYKVYMNVYECI